MKLVYIDRGGYCYRAEKPPYSLIFISYKQLNYYKRLGKLDLYLNRLEEKTNG